MLIGSDLEYNGMKLSDYKSQGYNFILGTFDSVDFKELDMGRTKDIDTIDVGNGIQRIIKNKYKDVIEDTGQILHCDGSKFSNDEYRMLEKWLNVKAYMPLFLYPETEKPPFYYNCITTNIMPIRYGVSIYGISFSIRCDSPFLWEDFSSTYTINNSNTIIFNNSSDDMDALFPIINFSANNTCDLIIRNLTTGIEWKVEKIMKDEIVTFDATTSVFNSNIPNRNFYNFYNKKLLQFCNGKNELEISGNGIITIKGRFSRKAGV